MVIIKRFEWRTLVKKFNLSLSSIKRVGNAVSSPRLHSSGQHVFRQCADIVSNWPIGQLTSEARSEAKCLS